MRVAVLTMCRDRLDYTQHCFAQLQKFAGIEFDHYVLDQGSTDGTREWLLEHYQPEFMFLRDENLGIVKGMNYLVDHLDGQYDVVVKIDNDCELTQPGTLRLVCELAQDSDAFLSPRILGLRRPPASTGEFTIMGHTILDIPQIGGIFLAVPGDIYKRFRYDESNPSEDDVQICWWWRGQAGRCGYVKELEAWHHETTDGQEARYPDYFERRVLEGKPL